MGSESFIIPLFVASIFALALFGVSLWLRISEVFLQSRCAREPSIGFWIWQLMKLVIALFLCWFALDLLGVILR